MARHFLFEGDLSLAHSQTHWAQLADLLKYFWLSYFAVEVFKCRGWIPTCELNLATLDQVGFNVFQLFLFSIIMQDDHPQWGTVFFGSVRTRPSPGRQDNVLDLKCKQCSRLLSQRGMRGTPSWASSWQHRGNSSGDKHGDKVPENWSELCDV